MDITWKSPEGHGKTSNGLVRVLQEHDKLDMNMIDDKSPFLVEFGPVIESGISNIQVRITGEDSKIYSLAKMLPFPIVHKDWDFGICFD